MVDLKDSETFRNLLELFSRDAQAAIRYQRFARTAEYEDCRELAELFRRLAENEALYAQGHLDFLRSVCDPISRQPFGHTVDNVAAALASETEDATTICPLFSRVAEAEGFVDIASWFRSIRASKAAAVSRLDATHRSPTAATPV